jgi:hypothetical protein
MQRRKTIDGERRSRCDESREPGIVYLCECSTPA